MVTAWLQRLVCWSIPRKLSMLQSLCIKKCNKNNCRYSQIIPIQITHDRNLHIRRHPEGGVRHHCFPSKDTTGSTGGTHQQLIGTCPVANIAHHDQEHYGTTSKGGKYKRHRHTHNIHPGINSEGNRAKPTS